MLAHSSIGECVTDGKRQQDRRREPARPVPAERGGNQHPCNLPDTATQQTMGRVLYGLPRGSIDLHHINYTIAGAAFEGEHTTRPRQIGDAAGGGCCLC